MLDKQKAAVNIIRVPLLRNILIASVAIAIVFPVYSVFFVYPAYFKLLIQSTEEDAVFTARHLTSMIIPEGRELMKDSFSDEAIQQIRELAVNFRLEKLNIFLSSGEIIYSTETEDIGHVNTEAYFHRIVGKGNIYTNVVRKDAKSLEGRVVESDVVEIYVPIFRDRKFNGAFEIYYNITDRREKLTGLLSRSSSILIMIGVSLLAFVVLILFKASKALIERSEAENALFQAHQELERRVNERTNELAEANRQLRREIAERKGTEEALRESEHRLHILSSRLLSAQERERRRISLELHDELGQSLTVLKLRLRSIRRGLQEGQQVLQQDCEDTLRYVDQIIENARRLSRDLSPAILEDLGVTAALRWLVQDFAKHSKIDISVELPDIDALFLQDAQIILYRIFQEALTNIGKHAQASRVWVAVEKCDDHIGFRIVDNGRGFDAKRIQARYPTAESLGLMAMDERVKMLDGTFSIESRPGAGTRIFFRIPMDQGKIRL